MSLDRGSIARPISISPPPKRRRIFTDSPANHPQKREYGAKGFQVGTENTQSHVPALHTKIEDRPSAPSLFFISSPVKLNFIEELPATSNVDTISLGGILGDVMIRECWLFNYLFDLDFVMRQFDTDVRNTIQVHIVHGSWRREDSNKIAIDDATKRYPNIDVTTAYMPEPFGTHHSKMIVLFRHDDLAQVVMLTGNMIERDWCMSQAIWQSPLLPLLKRDRAIDDSTTYPPGSGLRFKYDLIAYAKAYGAKLSDLVTQLNDFDFSEVRAALIASTPGRQRLQSIDPENETLWGWPSLKYILSHVVGTKSHTDHREARPEGNPPGRIPHVVIQISSIASLGAKWLTSTLLPALSILKKSTLQSRKIGITKTEKPRFSIVFPTAETIRKSVNGYASGASIHIKTQTQAQAKQLSELRPMLCHWAGDKDDTKIVRTAGRKRAAPHIKTYIRFSDSSMQQIDWAMVTSANLSTQAWGAAPSASGEVRICSYEIGVIVWPSLWKDANDHDGAVKMVPVFGRDTPVLDNRSEEHSSKIETSTGLEQGTSSLGQRKTSEADNGAKGGRTIGWRMPYSLPLVAYDKDEMPWCSTEPCNEPDWLGRTWPGYQR